MKSFVPELATARAFVSVRAANLCAIEGHIGEDVQAIAARDLGARLGPVWDALSARSAEPNIFARRWFLEPSLTHCAAPDDCELVALMRGGEAIGLVPLGRRSHYGPLRVSHVANWAHPNMFLSGAVMARGEEQVGWTALLDELAQRGEHYAVFGPLDRDGPVVRGLVEAVARSGHGCRLVRQESRALLRSELSDEDYWSQAVRGKKRKELRRQERRLGELGVLAFEWLDGAGDALTRWCDDFLALETAGWKGRQGSAMAADPATDQVFRDIVARAQAANSLAMCRLTLDGRPIAMLVTLIADGAGFLFKTAYDEILSAYSPGVVLQRHALALRERARLDWIDSCACPDHPMINSLWTERRSLGWYAISLSGGIHRLGFDALHTAKDWKRRLRERRHGDRPIKGGQA